MFKGQLRPLIEFKLFHVPFDNASLIKGRHHNQGRAAPFRPLLGTSDLRAEGIYYSFTSSLPKDLFNRLLQQSKGTQNP